MVYVRLDRNWTDRSGTSHATGDVVDVDAATLAELEADGVVAAAGEPLRIRPLAAAADGGADGDEEEWIGPGKEEEEPWIGPGKTGEKWIGPGKTTQEPAVPGRGDRK